MKVGIYATAKRTIGTRCRAGVKSWPTAVQDDVPGAGDLMDNVRFLHSCILPNVVLRQETEVSAPRNKSNQVKLEQHAIMTGGI